jgi:hypothetical protein
MDNPSGLVLPIHDKILMSDAALRIADSESASLPIPFPICISSHIIATGTISIQISVGT